MKRQSPISIIRTIAGEVHAATRRVLASLSGILTIEERRVPVRVRTPVRRVCDDPRRRFRHHRRYNR